MAILRWLSLLASAALLLAVIVANLRNGRIVDPVVLRRSARRLGWAIAGSFVFAFAIFAISMIGSFATVATVPPERKAAVLAAAIDGSAFSLRGSVWLLFTALIGVAVLRFRAGYHSPAKKS